MRNIVKSFATIVLCICGAVSATSCQTRGPHQVIDEFSEALKKKDSNALLPFLTIEPEYVSKRAFEEYLRIHPQREKTATISEKSKEQPELVNVSGPRPELRGEALVKYTVPIDLFFSQNRTVTEIVRIRQNENEALAQVKFGGSDSNTGDQYAPLIYDILLYKEGGEWKAFRFNARREDDERWYLYSFYANPTP